MVKDRPPNQLEVEPLLAYGSFQKGKMSKRPFKGKGYQVMMRNYLLHK